MEIPEDLPKIINDMSGTKKICIVDVEDKLYCWEPSKFKNEINLENVLPV